MGLFLSLSGVIGADSASVQQALKAFADQRGGGFEAGARVGRQLA